MLLPQHIVCIQYVILFFSFCQQRLLLRTIKETKCTLPTTKHGILCRFYYGLFTHDENAKTGYSFCYILLFGQIALILIETILWGCNHSLRRCNYCRLNYYSEKNIAVLCCAILYKLKLSISVAIPLHNLFHR